MLRHLDLFSGIGGFALAAKWAGFETIQFVEKDKFCQKVLNKHWPTVPIHDDIKTFHFMDKVDLLTGGFPCQPFSVAGKKKGFSDDRYLWPEMLRVIQLCKPTWIVAENVPGIFSSLDTILSDLESKGYDWRSFIIPASATGAPHKRDRLWIIANTNGFRCNKRFDNWQKGYLPPDFHWNFQTIHKEWTQFIPESWKTFNAQNWLEAVSDPNSIESAKGTEDIEAITKRCEWSFDTATIRSITTRDEGKETQPPVCGVDDGLPNIVDRNKSLGNAIVPQVVFPFLKIIHAQILSVAA